MALAAGACGTETSTQADSPVDVAVAPQAEPTDPAPLDVIAELDGHFDGHTLTFTPVRADGSGLTAQNYDVRGRVAIDGTESGVLQFTTTEAIVSNKHGRTTADPLCAANEKASPTTYFADGGAHFLKDAAFSRTPCTDGHLCAIVTIKNTAPSNYFDRLYAETSNFKPASFKGDNSAQPYSASNLSGYPDGFGLDNSTGLWSYGSLGPGETSTKVRMDFALPNCNDFTFRTTVKGSKRVTRYGVSASTQPFQDACAMQGSSGDLFATAPVAADTRDVAAPFPFTIYDRPIVSLAVNRYGFLHEGKERKTFASDLASLTNLDFPLTTYPWSVVPYWNSTAATSVCTAIGGTAPDNRTFVVTWKNTTTDHFVSAILYEKNDNVDFQYGGSARCTSTVWSGGVASVGIQGNGSTYKRANFNNGSFLSSTGCPAKGTAPGGLAVPTITMGQTRGSSPSNDPFTESNANTKLKEITAGDYSFANSNQQLCVNLTVSGTSATPSPWEVRIDMSLAPFNGLAPYPWNLQTQGQNQVVVADAGGGFARVTGTASSNPNDAWNSDWNNALLTSSQTLNKVKLCSFNTPPAISSNTDPTWYTLTTTQGTGADWADRRACVTVTATATVDPAYYPFDFVWQASLDLTAAKNKILSTKPPGTPNYIEWTQAQGAGYWTSTPTSYSPPQDTYNLVSGQNGGNNGNLNSKNMKTQTIKACVIGY